MLFWNCAFYVSLAVAILSIIFLAIRRYGKNKYYHSFINDDFVREVREGGAINYIYSTKHETKKYIEKYIFRKSAYERSVIVNYNQKYDSISFFIKVFNKRNKVIQVIEVKDTNTKLISKVFFVKKEAKKINIIIKEVNGVMLNHCEIMPIERKNIHFYAFFKSLIFFTLLFALRHIVAMIYLADQLRPFLLSSTNSLIIIILLIFSAILYALTYVAMKKKNWKNRNGEAIIYEFF